MMRVWLGLLLCTMAQAQSVVLVIGDGMGPTWVSAARHALGKPLGLDHLPFTALVRTASLDNPITDSAAAATALASGVKTKNGYLGVNGNGRPLASIAEIARKKGFKIGLVTNTSITHATPAAFYAHSRDRDNDAAIAAQLETERFDLLLGGGRNFFSSALLASLQKNYHVVRDQQGLWKSPAEKNILGLFAETHLPYEKDRTVSEKSPTLEAMVRFALPRLQESPRGFFLMIEGGRIDHAAHGNLYEKAISEVHALDNVVRYLIAKCDPRKVMILVTADHETGGLSLPGKQPRQIAPNFATTHHTATDVMLYGWGDNADGVRGTVENSDVFSLMREALDKKPDPR